MPTLLELFSGSGSVSVAFRARGWDTITLDSDRRCKADLAMDILKFEPSEHLPPGTKVDVIWASCPCQWYSTARNWKPSTPEELAFADSLVYKVLEIAKDLGCDSLFIENPARGKLKHRGILDHLHAREVHYCKYGKEYLKPTNIWTTTSWVPKQALCRHDCHASIFSLVTKHLRHRENLGKKNKGSKERIASIPVPLCNEIAEFCDDNLVGGAES